MYHKVAPVNRKSTVRGHYVPPALFRRHMIVLKALGFNSVPLSKLFAPGTELPPRPVAITFDDGYENFEKNALPVLRKVGMTSTVFLVSNQIGGTNQWDTRHGDVEERLMDAESVFRCEASGTEFGSHTTDHADLTAVSDEEAWSQIAGSKAALEGLLRHPVTTFCYPYGRKSRETMALVQKAGYRLACSTEKGTNSPATDRFALRRINVRSDSWTPVFLLKLLRTARNEG
jgi:peptidoglycan/xylan/chitin deacetylase (PgdA/CDA1 family)